MNSEFTDSLATTFPRLPQLFGSYLHEDWIEEYGTAEAAIRAFAQAVSPAVQAATADQLRELLGRDLSEAELAQALEDDFGSYHVPSMEGGSNREWLAEVLAILDEPG
jgi:hypothetical protein